MGPARVQESVNERQQTMDVDDMEHQQLDAIERTGCDSRVARRQQNVSAASVNLTRANHRFQANLYDTSTKARYTG